MSEHTSWPAGAPCWADITVTDLARSQAFYSRLLGWEFTDSSPEFGGYCNATVNGKAVAGMSPPMEGWEVITAWTVYLATDDVQKTHEAVVNAGGTAQMEPMEVGPFGWMGLWLDPAGAQFGGWQKKEHTGFELFAETGAPAWCDLMSSDREKAKQFFADVFGFTYTGMGDAPYDIFNVPGQEMAGGLGQSDSDFSGWNIAFQVDDVDASVKVAEEAGGTVTSDPMDFEFGRTCALAGPDGEAFAIYTPKQGG
jgi:predicted enzyme related to lactoylglutathione lyase